jgi:hypothetical protein
MNAVTALVGREILGDKLVRLFNEAELFCIL